MKRLFKLTQAENITDRVSNLVEVEGNYHRLNDFYAATTNILDFIQLDTISGDITKALTKPDQLLLSEREALRLFGSTQIIGNTLNHTEGQYNYRRYF